VSGKVLSNFHIGRALHGPLPCQLPVGNGLFEKARFRVMMRHQLRLGFFRLEKMVLYRLRYLLVVLPPGALQ
jgi:hypothetical protein